MLSILKAILTFLGLGFNLFLNLLRRGMDVLMSFHLAVVLAIVVVFRLVITAVSEIISTCFSAWVKISSSSFPDTSDVTDNLIPTSAYHIWCFVNYFHPVTETFVAVTFISGVWVSCMVYKHIKSWIPTV